MAVQVFHGIVPPGQEGERVDAYLARTWPELSRKCAQRVISAGGCFLNGHRLHVPAYKVQEGDRLRVCVDLDKRFVRFVLEARHILYEDEHLCVVGKPSGVPVNLSATGQEGSVQKGLADYWEAAGFDHHPAVLHRLDTGTSGIVLFGKTSAVERAVNAAFREKRIRKTYLALVSPPPADEKGVLRTNIARRLDRKNQYCVRRERGKPSVTRYELLARSGPPPVALLSVVPETGRPHQIRVHLAWAGSPIEGDVLYGGREGAGVFGLHAWRVEFAHPVTGAPLSLCAPVPPVWREAYPWIAAGVD